MAEPEERAGSSLPTVQLLGPRSGSELIGCTAAMLGGVVAGIALFVGAMVWTAVAADAGPFGNRITAVPIWLILTVVAAKLGVRLGRRRTVAAIVFEPDRCGFVPVQGPIEWHPRDSMTWRLILPSGRRRDSMRWHLLVRHRGRFLDRNLSLAFSPDPIAAAQVLRECVPNLEIINDAPHYDRRPPTGRAAPRGRADRPGTSRGEPGDTQ